MCTPSTPSCHAWQLCSFSQLSLRIIKNWGQKKTKKFENLWQASINLHPLNREGGCFELNQLWALLTTSTATHTFKNQMWHFLTREQVRREMLRKPFLKSKLRRQCLKTKGTKLFFWLTRTSTQPFFFCAIVYKMLFTLKIALKLYWQNS